MKPAKDIKINTNYKGLSIPIIVEGNIYEENLTKLNYNKEWLLSRLKENGIFSEKDVFYAALNSEGSFYISKGIEKASDINSIRH